MSWQWSLSEKSLHGLNLAWCRFHSICRFSIKHLDDNGLLSLPGGRQRWEAKREVPRNQAISVPRDLGGGIEEEEGQTTPLHVDRVLLSLVHGTVPCSFLNSDCHQTPFISVRSGCDLSINDSRPQTWTSTVLSSVSYIIFNTTECFVKVTNSD